MVRRLWGILCKGHATTFTFAATVILVVSAAVSPTTAQAQVTAETCGNGTQSSVKYWYCIYPSTDPSNKDVIIHLHGLGGSATTWRNATTYRNVRVYTARAGRTMPTVISISFGKLWLLTEVAAKNNKYNVVMNKLLPEFEKIAGFTGQGKRILIGESMGGFNALQMFSKDSSLFSRVAIICPAVADLSPWSTEAEIQDYIRRTGAQSIRVAFFVQVGADEFPTPADWEAHNPLLLATKIASPQTEVYLSGDERDEYGFFEGAAKLDKMFSSMFVNYQWDPIPNGSHCEMNTKAIADFLTK